MKTPAPGYCDFALIGKEIALLLQQRRSPTRLLTAAHPTNGVRLSHEQTRRLFDDRWRRPRKGITHAAKNNRQTWAPHEMIIRSPLKWAAAYTQINLGPPGQRRRRFAMTRSWLAGFLHCRPSNATLPVYFSQICQNRENGFNGATVTASPAHRSPPHERGLAFA